jgi:adenylate cyclase class 2
MGQTYEIELKFLVQDLGRLRSRLLALGAVQRRHPGRERNLLFDDNSHSIARRGGILRLRKDATGVSLTLKMPVSGAVQEEQAAAKVRQEFQTREEDFEAMRTILENLGYRVWSGYEKLREEYLLGDVVVSLDEMPFGRFAELEGPLEDIQRLARTLGLDLSKRIVRGYISLFMEAKEKIGFEDSYLGFEEWGHRGLDWSLLGVEPADG